MTTEKIDKIEKEAHELRKKYPSYRWGQALFDSLSRLYQPVAIGLIEYRPDCDPYYYDHPGLLQDFYKYLASVEVDE